MKKIFTLLLLVYSAVSFSQSLVISQVYGAGGNSGAVYNADFVEIKNNSGAAINLSGYSIQYGSSAVSGAWSGVFALPAATIPAGGYYLIQMSAAGTTGAALPAPDAVANPAIAMAAANGRVAIVNGTTALNACPATGYVDFVGYGSSTCFEGSGPTGALSATNAGLRKNNGCTDSNNNSADFDVAAPAPRNSSTAVNTCGAGPSPTLTPAPTTITNFGNVNVGSSSASSSFTVTGANLTGFPGNITITAPSNFEVSNNNSSWGSSTTISFAAATLASTTVYVRFSPAAAGALAGNVSITGGGVTTAVTVAVSGTGVAIVPTLGATALTAFGNVCVNATSNANSFNLNGVNLTNADITVGPLANYTFSTTAGGTYSASLTLTQTGGTFSQDIFVKFTPTGVQSYSGNIPVSGGGAATGITVAASGSGVNTAPSAAVNAATAVSYTSATLQGAVTDNGCSATSAYGFEYSTTNGFANGSGTVVTSSNLSSGAFSAPVAGLAPSTTYYYKSFAENAGGKAYSVQRSFTTLACIAATVSTDTVNITTSYYDAGVGGRVIDTGCSNVTAYGIEYSSIAGFANGNGTKVYSTNAVSGNFTTVIPGLLPGTKYYFKAFAVNTGGTAYGNQDTLETKKLPAGFVVYSVPVQRNGLVHYSLDNLSRGHYGVELINSSGQVVFRKDLQIQVGYIDDYFYLPSTLSRGVYTLAVSPDGKERVYKRILVQ